MSSFFKCGFTKDVLNYELMLGRKFDLPLIGVCAFLTKDISWLSSKQFEQLKEYHYGVWN